MLNDTLAYNISMSKEIIENTSVKVAFSPFCNFNCEYCGGNGERKNSPYPAVMEDYRSTPLTGGQILTTEQTTECFKALASAGFKRIRPTGGEPTLNPEWDILIENAHELGFSVDITTNGSRLNRYLDDKKNLPVGLTMVKISLDTDDPDEYKKINGGMGDLKDVEKAISRILNLGAYVRLNTVLTRDRCNPGAIKQILDYSETLGIQQTQLLDLVYYPNYPSANLERLASNKKYWEEQFVSFKEFEDTFSQIYPDSKFSFASGQFGVNFWKTTLPSGLVVTFKDSTSTMRDEKCFNCPVFCQEGRCLLRLGTDGNLTPCPDYKAELPDNFNIPESVKDGSFTQKIGVIKESLINSKRVRSIEMFAKAHNLKLPDKV